jgi:hypothetical protein
MIVVKDLTILKAIGKRFHLTFDKKHKYCLSNAYVNDIGKNLPRYFPYVVNGICKAVYELKYVDGCFNPYLCEVNISQINNSTDRIKNHCNHIMEKEIFPLPDSFINDFSKEKS